MPLKKNFSARRWGFNRPSEKALTRELKAASSRSPRTADKVHGDR